MNLSKRIFIAGAVIAIGTAVFLWSSFSVPPPVSPTEDRFSLTGVIIVQPGEPRIESGNFSVDNGRIQITSADVLPDIEILTEYEGSYIRPCYSAAQLARSTRMLSRAGTHSRMLSATGRRKR